LPLHGAIVGGMVQAGETYEDAFKRETLEEVNEEINKVIKNITEMQGDLNTYRNSNDHKKNLE
jgi:ADP-ribose pyrophosphatase YjhB (NUDIX family)